MLEARPQPGRRLHGERHYNGPVYTADGKMLKARPQPIKTQPGQGLSAMQPRRVCIASDLGAPVGR